MAADTKDRPLCLAIEMGHRLGEASSASDIGVLGRLAGEASDLAKAMGYKLAPLTIEWFDRAHARFGSGLSDAERERAFRCLIYAMSDLDPYGGGSSRLLDLEDRDEQGRLCSMDVLFEEFRSDAIRRMGRWERWLQAPQPYTAPSGWEAKLPAVCESVRDDPEQCREAGSWFDSEFSEAAVRTRSRVIEGVAQPPGVPPDRTRRRLPPEHRLRLDRQHEGDRGRALPPDHGRRLDPGSCRRPKSDNKSDNDSPRQAPSGRDTRHAKTRFWRPGAGIDGG